MSDYREIVAQIKQVYDLSEYLRSTGIELTPAGVNKWKARCPFHNEKTPSFVINDNFQNYRCFGCGVSGDLLSYVMAMENYNFYEAMKKLAEEKGIVIEIDESKIGIDYDSLYKILKLSANYYCKLFNDLPKQHAAKKEISDRKLTFDNSAQGNIKYGYSPDGNQLYKMLHSKGFSDDLIIQSGMCRRNDNSGDMYDFFRSRLMFVFTDRAGKPIGFSSRKIFEDDKRGKYVNSSDSPLFHKNRVLYNHALARLSASKEKNMFICEGQFDVAAFVEAGMGNAVASSGTAFSKEHINECNKLVGNNGELTFCFDGDEAGIKAAMKVFTNYPEVHENSRAVLFPQGQDPCDYLRVNGEEKFKEFVSSGESMVDFIINQTKNNFDMDSVLDRDKYVKECARVAKTITNPLLRENAMRIIALESFTSIDVVKDAVNAAKPYSSDEDFSLPESDSENGRPLVEGENEDNFEDLLELIDGDRYYNLCARFISLGMAKSAWRDSLARNLHLFPKEFKDFVNEFSKMKDKERIFPELFSNEKMAQHFMAKEYSPFYKLMSKEELMAQFIYLHDQIELEMERRVEAKFSNNILQVISGDAENIEMLRRALQQEQEFRERMEAKKTPNL